MSALPQFKVPFAYSIRPLQEVEFMRVVGNIAWNSSQEDYAFDSLAAAILRLPGFAGFRFEPLESLPHLPAYESLLPGSHASNSFARAPVIANGRSWGEIRLFFDPHGANAAESPVRLARFVGQQLGLLLNRLSLHRNRRELATRLDKLRNLIRRRKLIHNAAAVLANRRGISGVEAIAFMAAYARRTGRRLLDVSESLIIGCNAAMIPLPLHARLMSQPSEGRLQNAIRPHESKAVFSAQELAS